MKLAYWNFAVVICASLSACTSEGSSPQCENLCANAPSASPVEGGCTSDFITDLGYNTDHPDCVVLANAFVAGSATASQCNACYESIGVSGDHCSAAETMCFGGGGSADAAPGTIDAAPGSADAATSVNSCTALCALTPNATPTEGGCSSDAVENLGYDTNNVPCAILAASFAAGTGTAAECNACYGAISITDAHCSAVHDMCF